MTQATPLLSFGPDGPVTRRELRRLLAAVLSNVQADYIPADEYRQLLGYGKTRFCQLMVMGRFDKGIHPATKASKRKMIHRYFNPTTQEIELPGMDA